jgi:hypothetical protein
VITLTHHVDATGRRIDMLHGADHPRVVTNSIGRGRQDAAEGLPSDADDLAAAQLRNNTHPAIDRNGRMVVAIVNTVDDDRTVTGVHAVCGNRFVRPRRQVGREARSVDLEVYFPSRTGEKQPETGREKVPDCFGFCVHHSSPGKYTIIERIRSCLRLMTALYRRDFFLGAADSYRLGTSTGCWR